MKIEKNLFGYNGLQSDERSVQKRQTSYKSDLSLNGEYLIELFSFPDPKQRATQPEACGLRYLAFKVADIEASVRELNLNNITTEQIRVDEYTSKKFTFFRDPDDLPIELYEV